MALPPAQQLVVHAFQRALRDTHASPKVAQALIEAGIVESHLQNLNYGDRDSLGSLQERTSIYGRQQALDPYASAVRFIKQAQPLQGKYATPGQLAQAVQRSAFPGRYDQVARQASAVLGERGGGAGLGNAPVSSTPSQVSGQATDPRRQIALALLGFGGADPVTLAAQGRLAPQVRPAPNVASGGQAQPGGVTQFDGKPVASWIAPILKQARATGLWKGKVNSGERTKAQQLQAAGNFGLQHYPNGPLASNHVYGHGGAVDVSDPQGLKAALQHLHVTRLKSAMANDPVHFSQSGY